MPTTLPWDWYQGSIPDNVLLEEGCYVETSFSFLVFRSQAAAGLRMGGGASAYTGTMFDVGPEGVVDVGRYALLNSVRIICDSKIEIGDYALISWNVVLMDTYRAPLDSGSRRRYRQDVAAGRTPEPVPAKPIHIGSNVWIGFDSCILPGVTIGEGSIVGARSVVMESAPPYSVLAGNPARVIRQLEKSSDSYELATRF
ncbi:MAG TPA: acyltransferase [Bryobacteraceae bacterium]|jgi:acetyltransferase-like isoleucine patch superfamily enzyme|nr:acyltransferase [Bryobacteraceae bacterium]